MWKYLKEMLWKNFSLTYAWFFVSIWMEYFKVWCHLDTIYAKNFMN